MRTAKDKNRRSRLQPLRLCKYLAGAGLFGVLLLTALALYLKSDISEPFREKAFSVLQAKLSHADALPEHKTCDALYILGGSQTSLLPKFRLAARLYQDGSCRTVLTLSRPGITAYSFELERNLTNDEWTLKQLSEHGVPAADIETLAFEQEAFGTLTEAKGLVKVARQRDYQCLILLTTSHHTARVHLSFSHYLPDQELYVLASDKPVYLRYLLVEYCKYLVYTWFLL